MPFRALPTPASNVSYSLICFDAAGQERRDPDGIEGLMSRRVLETAASSGATDIFFFSHGWMGDVPAAIDQYNRWIGAVENSTGNRGAAEKVFPGFRPLYVGLHWPSLPWGDEEIGDTSFDAEGGITPEALYQTYLERLGDTPAIRSALSTIFEEARRNAAPAELPERAREAFFDLNEALGLRSEGAAGAPDADREPFDPDQALQAGEEASFGSWDVFSGMLGVVRLCSYWTMKKRGRTVGETGMHTFIRKLQQATPARIHLMGHSFGCVVISSILGGPDAKGVLDRPIDSTVLVQGAVSLWSYAAAIPFGGAGPGYFHRVIADGKIRGPLVTTQSRYDTAVGVQYPRASVLAAQVAFDPGEYPKYGAIGTFGLQGLPQTVQTEREMAAAEGEYAFEPGKVYNLEASRFIAKGGGSSGAHNDIDGPEVAHAIWQAAFASA